MPNTSFIRSVTPLYPFLFVRDSIPILSQKSVTDCCMVELNMTTELPPQNSVTFLIRCASTSERNQSSSPICAISSFRRCGQTKCKLWTEISQNLGVAFSGCVMALVNDKIIEVVGLKLVEIANDTLNTSADYK